MKQLVSILIPAYNAEKWIGGCIESALAQTWPRKEILVIDDGSRDLTLKIAKFYASSDVKVEAQENCGASAARNHALSLAQGDYIQWLDADDLLAPDKVAMQMEGAEPGQSSRVLLSGAWGKFYHRPENSKFVPDMLWEDLEPVEWLFRKINENLWMAIESWLVSRRLTEMAGPWDESLYRDNDGQYFCRVLTCSHSIRFISEARVLCRRGNLGISHDLTMNDRKKDSLLTSLFLYIQRLRSMEDSPRTREACLKLLSRWAIYFYPERIDIFRKMQLMAADLGGQLNTPKLRIKYRWIPYIFGWRAAKRVQNIMPFYRSFVEREWERLFFSAKNKQRLGN